VRTATGRLGLQGILDEVDFVVGAFSKSFATTSGFLATRSASVREFVRTFGGPQTFSSALTPVQTAGANAALGIIRSPEGAVRRKAVSAVAQRLRDRLESRGHRTMGDVICWSSRSSSAQPRPPASPPVSSRAAA
jgi:glycine C-acetyltransferase